ncbi:MAG: DUF6252 family protein [Bacteroidota bacterium]|nr:DUF6252 family protein [Bacteroidota bacterium]
MKSAKLLILFCVVIGLSMSACKKKDDETEPENNNPVAGSMTAKVDGSDWSASLAVVGVYSNNLFTVTGSDNNAKQLQVTVMNVNGTGEYTLGETLTNQNSGRWTAGLNTDQTYSTMLGQGSGTMNITGWTGTSAKGTFSFTAKNSKQEEVSITGGEFSVTFQQE